MTKTTVSQKKTCLNCTKEYAVSSFYSHRNPLINEKFGFCKKCVKSDVELDNMQTLIGFLQTMNIPYLKSFWKQANDAKTETIGTYFKNLNSLKQLADLTFKDSDDINGKTNTAELSDIEHEEFEITQKIVKRWGRGLEKDDYMMLESEYETLISSYACETHIQEMIFKNMAHTQLLASKSLEEGDVNKYEKLMKILSSQMNDANVKPVQESQNATDGGFHSFGEFIRMIEETEPIADSQDIYDKYEEGFIKKYVERFYITQIKRVFGLIRDEDIKPLEGENN